MPRFGVVCLIPRNSHSRCLDTMIWLSYGWRIRPVPRPQFTTRTLGDFIPKNISNIQKWLSLMNYFWYVINNPNLHSRLNQVKAKSLCQEQDLKNLWWCRRYSNQGLRDKKRLFLPTGLQPCLSLCFSGIHLLKSIHFSSLSSSSSPLWLIQIWQVPHTRSLGVNNQ
jgi:hypothetical protein